MFEPKVRWGQAQEASLANPCSNLRSFGSKCAVLKKVHETLLGLFGSLAVIRARGIVLPPFNLSLQPSTSLQSNV